MTTNTELNEDYWGLSRLLYSFGNEKESCIRTGTIYQLFLNKIVSDYSVKKCDVIGCFE